MENKGCCQSTPEKPGSCATKGCCGTLIKGALLGGIIMFIYLAASCYLLPWHKTTTLSFKQESAAASVMPAAADAQPDKVATEGAKIYAYDAKPDAAAEGAGKKDLNAKLGFSFLFCLFNALLLTALLKKNCGCPIRFSATAGLLIGTAAYIPNLIWHNAPLNYTLLGMADYLIAFTLAGAAIFHCLLKSDSCATNKGEEKKPGRH